MKKNTNFGPWIAVGVAVGTAMGVVFNNLTLGISVGILSALSIWLLASNKS
ncbi:MAG: hypothetical protein ACXITV_05685 [Luteibaculaceae bacterium]